MHKPFYYEKPLENVDQAWNFCITEQERIEDYVKEGLMMLKFHRRKAILLDDIRGMERSKRGRTMMPASSLHEYCEFVKSLTPNRIRAIYDMLKNATIGNAETIKIDNREYLTEEVGYIITFMTK